MGVIVAKTMLQTPEFFFSPAQWLSEPKEEEVTPVVIPQVQQEYHEQTWQEELRDKIQEVITEQGFDGVYLGEYTEASTTIAYNIEFPKSAKISVFESKLGSMGKLLDPISEPGSSEKVYRSLLFRNGTLEVTKEKQYCKKLFLQTVVDDDTGDEYQ